MTLETYAESHVDQAVLLQPLGREPPAITPANVRWLWDKRVPLGMQSAMIGMPGQGKSTLAILIAAQITKGELRGHLFGEPSHVLLISYEDVKEVRLRPMAEAAGADLDRLDFLHCRKTGYVIDLASQLGRIEEIVTETNARLLVIDPLVAGLPSDKIDSHRDQSVRAVLAPIAALAEKHDLAVLTLGHFSKGAMSALLGTGGSIGFVGAPRSILVFGVDPRDGADKHRDRVLAHAKSNVGKLQTSLEVKIVGDFIGDVEYGETSIEVPNLIETSRAEIGNSCDVYADDLVREKSADTPRKQAMRFLRELLSDGPHRAKEVIELAQDAGIPKRTLDRAKDDLGVKSVQKGREWWWELPVEPEEEEEEDES